jgi:uncharacterized SAM-binding protein YcdF (DUF218 family)
MFFFLSKTLSYLLMPLTIVFVCLVASVFIRNVRFKKRLFWCGLILFWFFTNEFISNEFMRAWEIPARRFDSLHKYKLGIVLTGTTLPLKPNDRVYFQRGADRVTHTVQLYKSGLIENILISGGTGRLLTKEEPEADLYKKAMILMGVPVEKITIENETRNTYESAVEVKKMLQDSVYRNSDLLLITSAFHMRRSLACYRKAGLEPDPFTTDFFSHERVFYFDTLLIPKVEALIVWHKLAKEWVGFIAYKIAGYV